MVILPQGEEYHQHSSCWLPEACLHLEGRCALQPPLKQHFWLCDHGAPFPPADWSQKTPLPLGWAHTGEGWVSTRSLSRKRQTSVAIQSRVSTSSDIQTIFWIFVQDTCVVCVDHHWVVDSLFRIKCKFPSRRDERCSTSVISYKILI